MLLPILHMFMISADVTFFESTLYFDKEISKNTSLESEDGSMFFLENSSSSYVNVDPVPQRYGQAYTRCAKFTTMCQLSLYLRSLTRYQ